MDFSSLLGLSMRLQYSTTSHRASQLINSASYNYIDIKKMCYLRMVSVTFMYSTYNINLLSLFAFCNHHFGTLFFVKLLPIYLNICYNFISRPILRFPSLSIFNSFISTHYPCFPHPLQWLNEVMKDIPVSILPGSLTLYLIT